jgi:NADH-quinone oxidoreductase subunit N
MEVSPFADFGSDLWANFSLVVTGVVGLLIVLYDAFSDRGVKLAAPATILTLAACLVFEILHLSAEPGLAFMGMLRTGGFAPFVNMTIVGSALLSVVLSVDYLKSIRQNRTEVYVLILFAVTGMVSMANANNLVMLFVGLETMSIALYILAGLVRTDSGAIESALKYFLLGAFSTGFFLYGVALLYGATGTMYLNLMLVGLEATGANVMFWGGAALLLVGFLFKVSAVPFHMWTPDVYQGAPTTITGFMATASKVAAFSSLIVVLSSAFPTERWTTALAVIAVITMIGGNLLALMQSNVKRMLAYSSVAHAGYILTGLAAGTAEGYAGALFYLMVYAIMNIGAFGVIAYLEWDGKTGREQTLDSLKGTGYQRPLLGVVMGFFMFSLAGFPPLAGFLGKFAVFAPAIDAGLLWLVIIGLLTSAISAVYYLRVLVVMWMSAPEADQAPRSYLGVSTSAQVVLLVCAVLLVVLTFAPALIEQTAGYFGAVAELASAR